jgi:hypothetical protein
MVKKAADKKVSKKIAAKATANNSPRIRKLNKKQTKLKAKKDVQKRTPLPGGFRLTIQVVKTLKQFWKPLGGIVLVYLVLNIIFASGVSNLSSAVGDIKDNLNSTSSSQSHPLAAAFSGFTSLVGSAGSSSSGTGSTLQGVLIVLESLVIIWALRQLLAGASIGVKQAYYQSMGPLVPFLLVVFVIVIQLLPISIGAGLFSLITTSIAGVSGLVMAIITVLFVLLAAWSFYMVSGSIFALYIVTLPGMHPKKALRSAKNLVKFRRLSVLWRVTFLPIFILVVMAVLIVPTILIFTPLVAPLFYVLGMLAILFVHTYLYSIYRSLIA